MIRLPVEHTPGWVRALRAGGLFLSVAFHGALAWMAMQDRPPEEKKPVWVEMAVVEKPPPPPPPPPAEPPKPKPPPKAVDFAKTVKEPPKDAPPPEAAPEKRTVRRVQGMSANSFAPGSGSGFDARAGTTLGTRATDEKLSIDEARESIPYAAAAVQPRLRFKPPLAVPDEVKANGIEGSVDILLDLDINGKVIRAELAPGKAPLGHGAEEACLEAWKKARYTPAMLGDQPVPVTRVPQRCTFKALE